MGWQAPSRGGRLSALAIDEAGELATPAFPLWPQHNETAVHGMAGDPGCAPPDATGFSGHGIAARPVDDDGITRVAVVAHGARETLELFDLSGRGRDAQLTWAGCIPLPRDTAGNDVSFHPDGRVFVTNYIPTVHGVRAWLSLRRGLRGEPTGDVIVWSSAAGWSHLPGTEAAIPNGIAVSPDGLWLFVAENGAGRIARYAVDGPRVRGRRERLLGGAPDNLSWSARGTLLAAVMDTSAAGAWRLTEIDPATLESRDLFRHEGARIAAVASAAETPTRVVVGTFVEDRVAVLPPTVGSARTPFRARAP
jgi:hypothetical protein